MAIAKWMQWAPRIRPWMVAVALAAGGCTRGAAGGGEVPAPPGPAAAARGDDGAAPPAANSVADAASAEPPGIPGVYGPPIAPEYGPPIAAPDDPPPCRPNTVYGPPTCGSDEQCVREHGAGWYCDPEPQTYPDGCGGTIVWGRTCECCRATEDAGDAASPAPDDAGTPHDVADVHKHDTSRPAPTYYGPPPTYYGPPPMVH